MKRKTSPFTYLFDKYKSSTPLNRDDYAHMRGHLILELIISNEQRSGIIQGLTVDEVLKAKCDLIGGRFHRLMIANHKTGYIQCATLFFVHTDIR